MGLKDLGTGMAIFIFFGVQTAHATHPLDSKKQSHTHVERYEPVRTTDNTVIVLTTGSPIIIETEDNVSVRDEVKVELRSA